MSFDSAVVATARVQTGTVYLTSFAGVCWKDAEGGRRMQVFSPADRNVALAIKTFESPEVSWDLVYVYVGRFLDRVVHIGREDFQVFRVHYNYFDEIVEEGERARYGEVLEAHLDPLRKAFRSVELENIWGPRWEDWERLVRPGVDEKPSGDMFTPCNVPVAESLEEYARHKTWATHPGILKDDGPGEYLDMRRRLRARPVERTM